MEERRLAFVLSGGGARGAFQVGALKALYENNIHPEILVGTSIGADLPPRVGPVFKW